MSSPERADIAPHWRMWMADNLARGAPHEDVLARLAHEGVDSALASRALQSILGRAQVIPGVARRWADLSAWTPEALSASQGELPVEVTIDRDRDPDYPQTFRRRTRIMPLRELCALMRTSASSDIYTVAQSHVLDRTPLRAYVDRTVRVPAHIARSGPWTSSLWLGPAGTTTPFHHDAMDILALQLHGTKRWRTIAPTDRAWLDATREQHASPYTMRDPALEGIEGVTIAEHLVCEGDALFVPASTWHHVVAETASATLSLTELAPMDDLVEGLGLLFPGRP